MMCWDILLDQNRALFENRNSTIESIVYKFCGFFNKTSVYKKDPLPWTFQSILLTGATMGFFDGVALENGTNSGVGGLIKLNDTSFITWTCNCGLGTNTRA